MPNINPIRFGITGYNRPEERQVIQEKPEQKKEGKKDQKQLGQEEVLSFLSMQNVDVIPKSTRTYNVSKYVTAEQEARIAEFMKGFEADFENASAIAKEEFPDIEQRTADNIALAYINATY